MVKFTTAWETDEKKEFINNPGNGKAIPEYYLDNVDNTIKIKVDADGVVSTHSLYDDIQKNKNINDYKKALAEGLPIENSIDWVEQDLSGVGSFAEIHKSFADIANKTGKNVFDLIKDYEAKVAAAQKAKEEAVAAPVETNEKIVEGENK